MKVTNDHYKHKFSGAWRFDDEREVYITDDDGALWHIRPDPKGGIVVTAHGRCLGEDQIAALGRAGNQLTLRASTP